MADPLRVDVRERTEQLVDVELHLEDRHNRLHLVEVARSAVNGFGDEFEHKVQVNLILLQVKSSASHRAFAIGRSYPLAIVVEEGLEFDYVGVPDDAHDLQLTVLVVVSADARTRFGHMRDSP